MREENRKKYWMNSHRSIDQSMHSIDSKFGAGGGRLGEQQDFSWIILFSLSLCLIFVSLSISFMTVYVHLFLPSFSVCAFSRLFSLSLSIYIINYWICSIFISIELNGRINGYYNSVYLYVCPSARCMRRFFRGLWFLIYFFLFSCVRHSLALTHTTWNQWPENTNEWTKRIFLFFQMEWILFCSLKLDFD